MIEELKIIKKAWIDGNQSLACQQCRRLIDSNPLSTHLVLLYYQLCVVSGEIDFDECYNLLDRAYEIAKVCDPDSIDILYEFTVFIDLYHEPVERLETLKQEFIANMKKFANSSIFDD